MASDTDIKDLAGGGLELTSGDGDVVTFDWFWNNTRSPNAGVDLRPQRWKFMADLMLFSPKLQMMAPRDVAARRDEMLAGFESVLDEPVYRLLLDLKSARAIARTGEVERARDILTTTVADTGEADAEYRLAHFEALAGDAEHATERLVRLITDPRESVFATRSMFDGPHLAIRTGIETFDQEAVETAIMQLSAKGMSEEKVRVAEALRARARLWWDQLQPEDLDVKSWSYAPAGDAVACLARWRKGVGKPEDADAMADFAQRYPDASVEGRLAGAAAAIGNGRSRQALDDLNLLTQQLSFPARDDFALRQLLDLAQALRIVALQADGQVGRAQVEAQNLRPSLTDALLPAILVDEIIANDRKPGKDGRSGLA